MKLNVTIKQERIKIRNFKKDKKRTKRTSLKYYSRQYRLARSENEFNVIFINYFPIRIGIWYLNILIKYIWLLLFNDTFHNISTLSWREMLLVENIRVSRERTTNIPQVPNNLDHIKLYLVHSAMWWTSDCKDRCISNYRKIGTLPENNNTQ
jgi:hypothetical protein